MFIPLVGPIVAAGPIGAVLLEAASGAIAGSAGAGLVSVLTTLGMPEDKAAIYQTRLQAGEFFMMAEVGSDRIGEFQLLLKSAGGEEIHTIEKTLARSCSVLVLDSATVQQTCLLKFALIFLMKPRVHLLSAIILYSKKKVTNLQPNKLLGRLFTSNMMKMKMVSGLKLRSKCEEGRGTRDTIW